jgi:hypothetical protein
MSESSNVSVPIDQNKVNNEILANLKIITDKIISVESDVSTIKKQVGGIELRVDKIELKSGMSSPLSFPPISDAAVSADILTSSVVNSDGSNILKPAVTSTGFQKAKGYNNEGRSLSTISRKTIVGSKSLPLDETDSSVEGDTNDKFNIFDAVTDFGVSSAALGNLDSIVMNNAPPFSLKLKNAFAGEIIDLFQAAYAYISEHQKPIKLMFAIEQVLKNSIRNELRPGMTTYRFDKLPDAEMRTLLRLKAQPKTIPDFIKFMKRSLRGRFPDMTGFNPSLKNFHVFYDNALTFTQFFMEVLDYLSLDKELVAPMYKTEKGPGGEVLEVSLVSLFLSFFPYKVGYGMHTVIHKKLTYSTMAKYVRAFEEGLLVEKDKCKLLEPTLDVMQKWRDSQPSSDHKKTYVSNLQLLENVVDSDDDDFICALSDNSRSKDAPKGYCWKKLWTDDCPKGRDCPYDHSKKALEIGRAEQLKFLSARVFREDGAPKVSAVRAEGYIRTDMHNNTAHHRVSAIESAESVAPEPISDREYQHRVSPM